MTEGQQGSYVSAPASQQQGMVNADRFHNAASYMEMTVPLLHEPVPANASLIKGSGAQTAQVRKNSFSSLEA